ncbi:ABC transporter permease family protein [Neoaquamicrobium sediminum]|uniref:ABC transporter permease n=1 Tax=Neoaquamicrobium sediminum TaxID=1849104 RepID=UPI001FD46EE0|nr:ABC transporter permease [Mesorhizobium sediminum]
MNFQDAWARFPRPLRIIALRLPMVVPQMLGVMLVTFLLVRLLPGDPALLMLGNTATPESIAALRERLGLDRTIWEQFIFYMGNVVQGDLGMSLFTSKPVVSDLLERAPATL